MLSWSVAPVSVGRMIRFLASILRVRLTTMTFSPNIGLPFFLGDLLYRNLLVLSKIADDGNLVKVRWLCLYKVTKKDVFLRIHLLICLFSSFRFLVQRNFEHEHILDKLEELVFLLLHGHSYGRSR